MNSSSIAVSIIEACKLSGISRAYLYQVMARGEVISKKCGKRRLVLVDSLRLWLRSLPTKGLSAQKTCGSESTVTTDNRFGLPSRCMLPVIFDLDGTWRGCLEDAAFFTSNKNASSAESVG